MSSYGPRSPAATPHHPREGDAAASPLRDAGSRVNEQTDEGDPVHAQTYEITFSGQAGSTLRAEFDDCEITLGRGTTTLRAELPDQAALSGFMQRLSDLRLEVIDMHLVAPEPDDD